MRHERDRLGSRAYRPGMGMWGRQSLRRRSTLRDLGAVLVLLVALAAVTYAAAGPRGPSSVDDLPDSTPSTVRSTTAATAEESLASARKTLRTTSSMVVLSDSKGTDPSTWVVQWARMLAIDRRVAIRTWEPVEQKFAARRTVFGRGLGHRLVIWSMAQPGSTADFSVIRLPLIPAANPGLVVLDYGRNNSADHRITGSLARAREAVQARWGEVAQVFLLQNPGAGKFAALQEDNVAALRAWAAKEELPVIDVWSAFEEAPGPTSLLLADEENPNEAGSRRWAQVVARALGPAA